MPIRIVWNNAAFEELRRDEATDALLNEHAREVAAKAGPGYIAVEGNGRTRDRAAVITSDAESVKDNAENNTLMRIVGGGG